MSCAWYLWKDEKKWGPYAQEELQRMVDEGSIRPRDLVWHGELKDWVEAKKVIRPSRKPSAVTGDRTEEAREFVAKALARMEAADYECEENVTWKGGGCWWLANQYKPAGFLLGATDCFFLFETFAKFDVRALADFTEDCGRFCKKQCQDPKAALWYFPVAIAPRLSERQVEKIRNSKPADYSDSVLTLPSVYEEATGYLYYYLNPMMLSWEARHYQKWVAYSNLLCRLLLGK